MSNGDCKVMRTGRSWPRRTTARAHPIRYPRNCAPVCPGCDACLLGAAQHRVARRLWCGGTVFDCLHSSAVLSAACRLLCYVGYNGALQAGSKPPEVAASWTVWNVRTATFQFCGGRINAPKALDRMDIGSVACFGCLRI